MSSTTKRSACRWLCYYIVRPVRRVLCREKVPVWLTAVFMALGAYATYVIAPAINEKFQMQAARREFLVKNLESLSQDVRTLIDNVGDLINEKDQNKRDVLIKTSTVGIAKLQFASVQLVRVVPEAADNILSMQSALQELQLSLPLGGVNGDAARMKDALKRILSESTTVYDRLLTKAGLSTPNQISRSPRGS